MIFLAVGAISSLGAATGESPAAVVLEARDAFLRPRCADSGERPLVPGDLIRRAADPCPSGPDRVIVRPGGAVVWAVCTDAGAYRRSLPPGEHDASSPGVEIEELRASEAGFCSSLNLEVVLDAGVQHVRELIAREARACASVPECEPAASPAASVNHLQVLGRANAADAAGRHCEALALYRELAIRWKDAGWIEHKLAQIEFTRVLAMLQKRPAIPGKVASLSIGIARYQQGQKSLGEDNLIFPANNAVLFGKYFKSMGAEGPVVTITREESDPSPRVTAARLVAGFVKLTCMSGIAPDAVVFVSAHGHQDRSRTSYIVPEDGYSPNSRITGVSIRQIQDVLRPFSRTHVFIDACREPGNVAPHFGVLSDYLKTVPRPTARPLDIVIQSAPAGGTAETNFDAAKARCANATGLLRCGPQQADGYGDFAYHFIDGVANRSDLGTLTGRMLRSSLTKKLPSNKAPDFGGLSNDDELPLLKAVPLTAQPVSRRAPPGRSPFVNAAFFQPPPGDAVLEQARRRVRSGAEIADPEALARAAANASPEQVEETRLTLEDAGQAVIRRYLEGDEAAPGPEWFRAGASYYRAAAALVPGSAMYRSRALFCEARLEMFLVPLERNPSARARIVAADVMPKLWAAQRLDPEAAYTLNAMGIAHLESGLYEDARRYLSDAVRRQPDWAYPRHNLALTYMQQGRSRDAVDAFGRAIDSAPNYAYLHHNLALLYQRLNRRRDAETSYRKAEALLADLAERRPEDAEQWRDKRANLYNAWGTLRAQARDTRGARALYVRAAEERNLPETAHNLALLETGAPRASMLRAAFAKRPDHWATRVELARTLAAADDAEGVRMLEAIVKERPEFAGAWIDLGLAFVRARDFGRAQDAARQAGEGWRASLLQALIARSGGNTALAAAKRKEAERAAGADPAARKEIGSEWKRKPKPVR